MHLSLEIVSELLNFGVEEDFLLVRLFALHAVDASLQLLDAEILQSQRMVASVSMTIDVISIQTPSASLRLSFLVTKFYLVVNDFLLFERVVVELADLALQVFDGRPSALQAPTHAALKINLKRMYVRMCDS